MCRPRGKLKLRTKKVFNSDCIKRCCVVCRDHNQSPSEKAIASNIVVSSTTVKIQVLSGGESCIAHYFKGKYWAEKLFYWEKAHGSKGWYSEESDIPRSDMRGLLIQKNYQNLAQESPHHPPGCQHWWLQSRQPPPAPESGWESATWDKGRCPRAPV